MVTARSGFLGTQRVLSQFIDDVPAAPSIAAFSLLVKDASSFVHRLEKQGMKVNSTARGNSVKLPPSLGGTWLF